MTGRVHLQLDPEECSHLEQERPLNLDDLEPWRFPSRLFDQGLNISVPPTPVLLEVLAGVPVQKPVHDPVPAFSVLQENDPSRAGLDGRGEVGDDGDGVGDGAQTKRLDDGVVLGCLLARRRRGQRVVGVRVHQPEEPVEVGELPTHAAGHGARLDDGRRGRHGRNGPGELAPRDVEHVGRDVQAGEGGDAAGFGGGGGGGGAVVVVGGGGGAREGLPIVVLEVAAGAHGELEDGAVGAVGEAAAERGDAHPPLGEVELLVELLGVVGRHGEGPAGGRLVGMVMVAAGGGCRLEGGREGAEDVEAHEAGDDGRAGEGQPGGAPLVAEGRRLLRRRGRCRLGWSRTTDVYIYCQSSAREVLWDASNLRLILSGDVRDRLLLLLNGLRPGWLAGKPSR